jgi:hypothetical protein
MTLFSFSPTTAAALIGFLTPTVVILLGVARDRRIQKQMEQSPQREKLLRPPGHSLSTRLDDLGDRLYMALIIAGFVSAMAATFITATVQVWAGGAGVVWIALGAVVSVTLLSFSINRILVTFALIEDMRTCPLGLRGEQAVAESLHELAAAGYRVFHDLPGHEICPGEAKWNIDHVLVGPRGVFVVETKARMRRTGNGRAAPHEVTINGEKLVYASGSDLEAIPQAKNNARTLARFLTKETGEPVNVDWLVVIPGYFVKADKDNYAHVMNATAAARFLPGLPERIEPAQVRRIANAVDKKCRDVEF